MDLGKPRSKKRTLRGRMIMRSVVEKPEEELDTLSDGLLECEFVQFAFLCLYSQFLQSEYKSLVITFK